MSKKLLLIGIVIGLSIGLIAGLFLPQILSSPSQLTEIANPRIVCFALESGTSGWYKGSLYPSGNSPVIGQYYPDSGEYTPMPQSANLGVDVTNNNTQSLFNIVIEVSYKTSENKWNTTSRIAIGFLDIQEHKEVHINLANPSLSIWDTQEAVYGNPDTHWRSVTAYVLDATNYKITAYGYAKQ